MKRPPPLARRLGLGRIRNGDVQIHQGGDQSSVARIYTKRCYFKRGRAGIYTIRAGSMAVTVSAAEAELKCATFVLQH